MVSSSKFHTQTRIKKLFHVFQFHYILNFVILGDSVKLDESVVENELNAIGALVPNEKIKLAYKCGRDMVICTSKRMLYVDTQGFSGKRIEYLSMRYSCIKGYEVETAGSWDRDAEFKIFTNISQEKRCLKTDLRKGQCDVMEVLWYFNNRLLGVDSMTLEEFLPLGNTFLIAYASASVGLPISSFLVNNITEKLRPLLTF